ncbi:hypothetical protein L873DRAFT_1800440 [Choiromyces venosus 120613-1]|uniref:Uncharacterized protein n=1 Tax=Choiromyces venosus 120613-1 TaxID=1336337 RepID=A0A3N4KD99_9PEZI|nr:hypothetical protein L873DRAFT_1800440 [Choiromyces venosus 120613-1]
MPTNFSNFSGWAYYMSWLRGKHLEKSHFWCVLDVVHGLFDRYCTQPTNPASTSSFQCLRFKPFPFPFVIGSPRTTT